MSLQLTKKNCEKAQSQLSCEYVQIENENNNIERKFNFENSLFDSLNHLDIKPNNSNDLHENINNSRNAINTCNTLKESSNECGSNSKQINYINSTRINSHQLNEKNYSIQHISSHNKNNCEEKMFLRSDSIIGNENLRIKNSIFTIRRNLYNANEEYKEVEFLKRFIEFKLKMILPEDIGVALKDGVILCHLMNQIFPRTIQIIHVPSSAMPNLTIAKCRKNIESFIYACKKFGLKSDEICSSQDIIESKNTFKIATA